MEETLKEFRRFDLAGSGTMAREVLAGVLCECTEMPGDDIAALLDAVDTEGTGRIKYEQFVVWLFGHEASSPECGVLHCVSSPREQLSARRREDPPKEALGVAALPPTTPRSRLAIGGSRPEQALRGTEPAEGTEVKEEPLGDSASTCLPDTSEAHVTASFCQADSSSSALEGISQEEEDHAGGNASICCLGANEARTTASACQADTSSSSRAGTPQEHSSGATGSTCSLEPALGAPSSTWSRDCSPVSVSKAAGAADSPFSVPETRAASPADATEAVATEAVATARQAAPAEVTQICRYCLDSGDADDLVSPCACRGSSGFVHVKCLLSYAKQQQQEQTGIDVTCPTCKTPYMGTAALRLLPLALEDVKRRHGSKHVAVARVLKTMAGNHLSLMQFEEAKRCIEAATEMHRNLQDAPFDIAGEPIDMAEVLAIRIMIDQGMYAILQDSRWDAKTSAETVKQVVSLLDEHYKHECGPDAPRVAGVLMSLCLGDSDRPVRQRIKLLQRALGLLEGYYGKERADEYANTLNVLTTMAILAGEVGDFETVKVLSERSIAVQKRHSGPSHPTTLMSCCLLVCAQLKLGELSEARELLDEVICVAEQTEFMPALAPAMRVVRARLLGELGDAKSMRAECLKVAEEAGARCDLYTRLKGPEPACTLREAEVVLGIVGDVASLVSEPLERAADSPGSDWEDQLRDFLVRVVLGDYQQAMHSARVSVRELHTALGVDSLRVMSASVAYVRRFWERHLKGSTLAEVQAWLRELVEYAAALTCASRLCSRATVCCLDQRSRPGTAGQQPPLEMALSQETVVYGATRADVFTAGDRVRTLVNMAGLPGWALQEGDEGSIEAPGPLHGCASIRFGRGSVVLPLTDVCRPCHFEERMQSRALPCRGLAVGQNVRSLVSAACHPRPLARGVEGCITAVDRTRGRANVDFGGGAEGSEERLQVTLLLSDLSPVDEFELRLEVRRRALGGFFVGETVRSLIHLPLQPVRPLQFGAEGVVAMLDVQHRRVLVRFGDAEAVQILLRLQDVCLVEEFEARTEERKAVLAGLLPGDRVRSLVACLDWVPRPLHVGDEGTILMINPVTNRALVEFAGDETLRGEMDPGSVCPSCDFEARRAPTEPPHPPSPG